LVPEAVSLDDERKRKAVSDESAVDFDAERPLKRSRTENSSDKQGDKNSNSKVAGGECTLL
jgi:hypothetical protein